MIKEKLFISLKKNKYHLILLVVSNILCGRIKGGFKLTFNFLYNFKLTQFIIKPEDKYQFLKSGFLDGIKT